MGLLLELADYSLSQFRSVSQDACTSRIRQWDVPGETMQKTPVMETAVQKLPSTKEITLTLYDPRKVDDRVINWEKNNILKERLTERNNITTLVTCVPPKCDGKKVNTRYVMFQIGLLLSFHLNPVGFTSNFITNILDLSMSSFTTHELPKLPQSFISEEHDVVPKNWVLTEDQRGFLATIQVRHGRIYEPVAREKYLDVKKFHLNRNIDVRETGLVLQSKLFWLAASPDGLVLDKSNEDVLQIGLIKIKCPQSKKNSKIGDVYMISRSTLNMRMGYQY